MINKSAQSGFILVMALMIISLVVLITGIMTNVGDSYVPYMVAMAQRNKARILALGGIACAQSQLGMAVESEKSKDEKQPQKAPTPDQEAIGLLKNILPILNKWQTVPLTLEKEGIDGTIQFRITCEDGKLNLNELFDFKAKKFKDDKKGDKSIKALLVTLLTPVEKRMKTPDLLQTIETLLAKRGYPLNDVTELLTNAGFAGFKHTQFPSVEPYTKKSAESIPPFVLSDLFTTHTNQMNIEPWLLSDSLRKLCNIPEQETKQHKKDEQEKIAELLKKFKVTADWNKDWDERLKPFYGVTLKQLPQNIIQIFTKSFEPRIFSVMVSATVGDSTQHLYAILERIKKSQDTKTLYDIYIRTFYWI